MVDTDVQEDVKKKIRVHVAVYLGLLLLTGETVLISFSDFEAGAKMVIALTIAACQGFLILGFLLHLFEERKTIYSLMILTGVFLGVLFGLTLWAFYDTPEGQILAEQTIERAPQGSPEVTEH